MEELREKIARLVRYYYFHDNADIVRSDVTADQILALIKEAGYVRLPPDSAILENISLLKDLIEGGERWRRH